ncbi:MAG: 1-acyl-sn-glycerol-3-phosphate acyltransferase [Gammaproteobacteria bacterium]|nr:1-acyl-sn-glycerol-3-phosphate acyltransferase [Gammaproteobacteria bacterium]MCP5409502.1 1-acyl-sn-glycerol-3-phosphate acyltransferase [Chromatiaceae bacterium]MCP5444774.1 1-acyl-sn-glycerol-3-phosphate acyltransferase [Chromatiaceae bacterium]
MILFRSLLYFACLVISTTLFGITLATFGWLLSFSGRSKIANQWARVNLIMQKSICGLDFQVDGLENIPSNNTIVLSKHQSAWETIALRCILPPEQTWVLKQELMWIPIFGWALAAAQPIAIDRKSGRRAAGQIIEQGSKRLKQGRTVVIFPEGTRVAPGNRKKYGIGGGLLAEKTGYPVLPIAHNAGVFWRRRGIKKFPGTIQVVIGPVINTNGLSAIEINKRAEQWIENTLSQLPQQH